MITGYPGTRKTALAFQLEKAVRKHNGCFCSGKYDLQDRSLPYSAISTALVRLLEEIFQAEERFGEVQSKILAAIGREGQHVLREVIPNLHVLFAADESSREEKILVEGTNPVGSAQEKAKLLFLLRQLIRAVCEAFSPVVLFLDDLQWVDSASLDLLHALATDRDIRGLLILGCYRDNEVWDDHKLSTFLRELEAPGADGAENVRISFITVDNLDQHAINDLLVDLLRTSDSSESKTLARILLERTFGNVFHVIQFLKTLREMGLLNYNLGLCQWQWNNEEIQSRMNVTDNVAELLRLEMENLLSVEARIALQLAACLGNEFEESTLVMVTTMLSGKCAEEGFRWEAPTVDKDEVKQCLEQCVKGGFLYRRATPVAITYRFVHDLIQGAAISLIESGKLELVQFSMGKALIENLSTEEVDRNLFVTVNFLNHGAKLKSLEEKNRSLLFNLNFQAGKKALKSSAFEAATKYLACSVGLLGHDCWDDKNYASSLDLFSTAAQAEYCNGNLEQCRSYINEVLAQTDRPIQGKLPAYVTLIESYNVQEQHSEALRTNLMVLKQVGVRFAPEGLLPLATISALQKTRRLLRNMDAADLLDLPTMTDKTKLMAMKLMDIALVSFEAG
jgi:predicted ATPase